MKLMKRYPSSLGRLAAFVLSAALLLPTAAWAADKPQTHQGGDLTVTARQIEERLSAELKAYGHQATIITAAQIEEGQYQDVFQVLEAMVPGMFIAMKTGPGDYARYYLHGSSEILWLIDGVRVNNRLYSSGYMDTISPNLIERIEVLYGGQGLFYGTEAAGGIINVITKPVTKKTTGQVGVAYGSYEHRDIHAYVSDTVAGNGFMVFASNDAWDGYQPFSNAVLNAFGNTRRETRSYNRTNVGVKYRREFNFLGRGVLRAHYQHNTNPAQFARPSEQFALNDRKENLAILKWDHDINNNFSYYVKAYYHDWWTDYTRRELDGSYIFDEALWGYQDWGVNLMSSYRFGGGHEILAGIDYQNYYGYDEVLIIKGDHEQVWAAFAQYRPYLPFAPFIKPSVGVRYNKTGGNDKLIWSATLRGDFAHGLYFRGVVGTSFILPNACQLYADEDTYKGNPDLKPEESLNLDLGIGVRQGLFFAEAGYFFQKIKDLITLGPNDGDRDMYQNVGGESEVKGYTLMAGVGPFLGFSVHASYTYTDATAGDSGEQLDRVPQNTFKAGLKWRHDFSTTCLAGLDITARHVGDMKDYGTEYGNYWLADAAIFVKFGDKKQHMLNLRADNIFDEKYSSQLGKGALDSGDTLIYGYQGMPMTVMVGYTYYFN